MKPEAAEYLRAGLKAVSLRQTVIANNIANLETPGFRRSAVEFEKRLTEAIQSGQDRELATLAGEVYQPMEGEVNSTGNDVNIDVEVGDMIKTTGQYKTYMRLLAKLYRQMEQAMAVE